MEQKTIGTNKFHANKLPYTFDPVQLLEWKTGFEKELEDCSTNLYSVTPVKSHPDFYFLNNRRTRLKNWVKLIGIRLNELTEPTRDLSFYEEFVNHVRSTNKPLFLFICSQLKTKCSD